MKTKIHAISGVLGFLCILAFLMATVFSVLFGSYDTMTTVKQLIFYGTFLVHCVSASWEKSRSMTYRTSTA